MTIKYDKNITIAMYDLEDNLITVFDSWQECANYFNTSTGVIRSYICRQQKGQRDKKRYKDKWVRLFKIEEE